MHLFSMAFKKNKMTFQSPSRFDKTTQSLKDLIKINNDRIGGYQAALMQSRSLDLSTRDVFRTIIEEGLVYVQELKEKVKVRDTNIRTNPNILGKIYMAWNDLKVTFATDTRRAIIANCLYNEEIALHAYRAALSNDSDIDGDVLQLLADHEAGLKRNSELLKRYRDVRLMADSQVMYLV